MMDYYEKEKERLENIIRNTKNDKPYIAKNCLKRLADLIKEE